MDRETAADAAGEVGSEARPARVPWRPAAVAVVALVLGLLVTAALALTARILYDHNETRLLRLRGRELYLVLSGIVPSIQAPLASADELADLTNGNVTRFTALVRADVGAGKQFSSLSLWPLARSAPRPSAVLGSAPKLDDAPALARRLFLAAKHSPGLKVEGMLTAGVPSIGYAYTTPGVNGGFAVYAESPLPKSRHLTLPSSDGLTGLDYALYLGRSRRASDLMLGDLPRLPIGGERASYTVPFANSALTLVVTPNGSLGGTFFDDLPWIIAGTGLLLALTGALMTDRLSQRRRHAEALAETLDRVARENRAMYSEQRTIAETLQHALLPDALPELQGLQTCARYVPAAGEIEVGGDWYDVITFGDRQALLVIGDVSGHGLPAATTMATLRHATLAYAAQDHRPASVLTRLAAFANRNEHDHFATVLCASIDLERRSVTLASAGHLAPLLVEAGRASFVEIAVGVPIGVQSASADYRETSIPMSGGATLIAYTDGLVERRRESLDVGMARLRDAALGEPLELHELIAKLIAELASADNDDTAILGVRWEI